MSEIAGENLDLSLVLAYFLFALADSVIYVGLFWILRKAFRYHKFRVVGVLIVIAPFIFLLSTSKSLIDLLWMLFFTPVYGLVIMFMAFPNWMLLYYAISFSLLIVAHYALSRRHEFPHRESSDSDKLRENIEN